MSDTSTPTPTPSPTAQSAPPTDTTLGGIHFSLDPNGNKKKTTTPADKYGLGLWGQQAVNTQGLFNLAPGQDTADDVMRAFLQGSNNSATTAIIAAIQHAMFLSGGYYSATYTPVPGLVRPQDQSAFAKFLIQNAQANANTTDTTKKIPLAQQLQDAASRGVAVGPAAIKPVTPKTYVLPAKLDLYGAAQAAAQSVLGRNASDSEKKAFTAFYDSMILNFQKQEYADAQQMYPTLPAQAPQAAPELVGGQNASDMPGGSTYNQQVPQAAQAPTAATGTAEERYLIDSGQQAPASAAPVPSLMTPNDFASHISDITDLAQQMQDQRNALQYSNVPTHVLEQASSPSEAAAAWFKEHNPNEAASNSMDSAMGSFLRVIQNGMMK